MQIVIVFVQNLKPILSRSLYPAEFEKYKNLSKSIYVDTIKQEIDRKGCFKTNCRQKIWEVKTASKTTENPNGTSLIYILPSNSKVLVREEIPLFPFFSFLADIGGYLGLLLGESIFSFSDKGYALFKLVMKKVFYFWTRKKLISNGKHPRWIL